MKTINYKKMKGFSLIEVLIAISILLVGVLSAFALVSKSLASAPIIQDRLVASFLAQEKLEEIRRIRDTNFLEILNPADPDDPISPASGHWHTGIDNSLSDNVQVMGEGTYFKRDVDVDIDTDANKELIVKCKVSWETKGHEYHFWAEDHLFNWINI